MEGLKIMQSLIDSANFRFYHCPHIEEYRGKKFIHYEYILSSPMEISKAFYMLTLVVWAGDFLEFKMDRHIDLDFGNDAEVVANAKDLLAIEYLNTKMLLRSEIQGLVESGKIEFPQYIKIPERPKDSYEYKTTNRS